MNVPHGIAAAAVAAALGAIGAPEAGLAAPKPKSMQQPACASDGAACAVLTGQLFKRVLRSFSFLSTTNGTATYHFTGSLYCGNEADGPRAVDLDVGIVTATGGPPPSRSGPGGKRIAGLIPGKQGVAYSTSFDLSATFSTTTVKDRYQGPSFVAHGYIAPGVTCYVYGGSFSVDVFP